jgi:hypothetical protein
MSERELWAPSNGTEGEMFAANRCGRCVNDRFNTETGEGESCPIWLTLLIGDEDPHVYWDDENKHGECDMFCDRAIFNALASEEGRNTG